VAGVLLYRPVVNSHEITWYKKEPGLNRPALSAKEIFFPPTERMFTIHKKGAEIALEESFPVWETVIFGVRPCDSRGVKILDANFLDTNPVDVFYARRRANTTIIGLACDQQGPSCFCTSVGGKPDDAHDMDIILYETNDDYLVEAVTDKGRFLIPGGEWKESSSVHLITNREKPIHIPPRKTWPEHYNDRFWAMISDRCLSCRACAFVCPTCRCFSVRDETTVSGENVRIRCWDSCAGENYRRMAGGHKQRSEISERLRNRIFCKFYYYPEQYGLGDSIACTGCGRCIDVCPAGVDITEIVLGLEQQT
jgi:sulfhydrogenase subunit beta (sulfur reductase)